MEITPNRGDWVSMLGMAREVRAHFGGELRWPPLAPAEDARPAADDVDVEIRDRGGCHRYVARVVRGVRVGPSPAWLVARLEAAGVRSVNDVVDVTNLVMLELGQPLHAFDLDRLRGGRVVVRVAGEGEKILTLDGQTRELDPGDLVIADAEGPVAIAGVMGGGESEVGPGTTSVLIESAHFDPSRVRRTARRLGLHSESSYRFERGVDREGQARAADRAARLIAELGGGRVSRGAVEARGEPAPFTEEIRLDPARVNRLLGTELAPEAMRGLLARLEVATEPAGDALLCRPPSHRNDLHEPADLVEEIARIHGYDRIEGTLPSGRPAGVAVPPLRPLREAARDSLAAAGLIETMSFPAGPADDADALGLSPDDPRRRTVSILNPIQAHDAVLRSSVVPSLLRLAQANLARQIDRVAAFEVSRVFRGGDDPGALPREPLEAGALLADAGERRLWDGGEVPVFFRAKGVGERLLADLERPADFRAGSDEPFLHPGASGTFAVDGRPVAVVGELHPDVAATFGIRVPAALLVADLSALGELPARLPRYHEVSRQPSVRRDLAVLLGHDVPAGEVLEAVRAKAGAALVSAEIFDRYEGRGVPEGKVSLAFRLVFQHAERTLTDAEVARATDRVVNLLEKRFGESSARPKRMRSEGCVPGGADRDGRPGRGSRPGVWGKGRDQGRHRRAHLRAGGLLQEGVRGARGEGLRDHQGHPRGRGEGQDLGVRELRGPREERPEGPQSADG